MRYLLDTMVLSEPAKPTPNRGALDWLGTQAALDLGVSVVSLGEIQRGIARMDDSRRKTTLRRWLASELPQQFNDRILPVDLDVALTWGELTVEGDRSGRPLPVVDGLLLATAKAHGLTLVTRNENDFTNRGVPIHNPYG